MRPIACQECGKVYEGESAAKTPCPRCVALDLLMPDAPRHDTPAVAIPFAIIRSSESARHKITTDGVHGKAPSQVDESPSPVVIPGPPSPLSHTLVESRPAPEPAEIAQLVGRFGASEPTAKWMDRYEDDLALARAERVRVRDTTSCPRCAETIKARALVCRFCGCEFEDDEDDEPVRRPRSKWRLLAKISRKGRSLRRHVGVRRSGDCECGGFFVYRTPTWAIVFAVLLFPIGLLALIAKEQRCSRCGR